MGPQSGINKGVYENYILYLRTKPKKQNDPKKKDVIENLSAQTIQSYCRHLRAVINFFIHERGYTDYFKIELPKAEDRVKEPYSKKEMEILLKKPDVKTCRFSEYRNWVIANYLAGTANRISTAISLKICDLDHAVTRHLSKAQGSGYVQQQETKQSFSHSALRCRATF